MINHGMGSAWDEDEFNKMFNLFEEDEPADGGASKVDENGQRKEEGLDRSEFTKLVKRVAQL